jgi:hypothetical protein
MPARCITGQTPSPGAARLLSLLDAVVWIEGGRSLNFFPFLPVSTCICVWKGFVAQKFWAFPSFFTGARTFCMRKT